MRPGDVFHIEIRSEDPLATRTFMSKVFGWAFHETPHPAYHVIETPGGGEGHIGPVPDEDAGASVTSYLLVDDIDRAAISIASAGGTILRPREEAGENGSYLWFEAPGGAVFVAWQHR